MLFYSKSQLNNKLIQNPGIEDPSHLPTTFVLIMLSIGATIWGYLTQEVFLGAGTELFNNSLFTHPDHIRLFDGSLSEFTFLK
jgi:hypothetical protein